MKMSAREIVEVWEDKIEALKDMPVKSGESPAFRKGVISGVESCINQLKKWGK